MASEEFFREQCNALGKRNLAAIERVVTLKYRRGAAFNRQRSADRASATGATQNEIRKMGLGDGEPE